MSMIQPPSANFCTSTALIVSMMRFGSTINAVAGTCGGSNTAADCQEASSRPTMFQPGSSRLASYFSPP